MEYMDSLRNYEKLGVPRGAGTDSGDGFDLGRMRRLMHLLGNPQSKFKVRTLSRMFVSGIERPVWLLKKKGIKIA